MNTIALFEAKSKLSELLDRVQRGEELLITRHGVPVAKLVPAGKTSLQGVAAAVGLWKQCRKGSLLNSPDADRLTVRDLTDTGRR